ncbi:asparaginase [Desulforamulus hydrothermalis]|uniref:Asparaginase n=1 Tax=Desulforamulus hydrothermalis Lam5 = DSM 18033 TaxID=1121428 RepID=K8E7G9_9FIRM|nr:asparaginase [Desulforamulus hydrothermalis]CCO07458.1 Asparaginase [Desulforamulus hydrothermalis Lam5 = DSM 18033]SHH18055.1 asparaginase [Desulforamulus hydrothermalis Lam5 = DSM 18033]
MAEILVKVIRGDLVESQHRGHLVMVDRNGKVLFSLGNPGHVTYWRSAAKPFQAVPVLERHAVERFGLTGPEIALFTSSHGGEEQHIQAIYHLLQKLGLTESFLDCGAAAPMHAPSAKKLTASGKEFTAVHNACSGKHSGMLALALLLDAPLTGYLHPDHPVQQEMLQTVCQCSELTPDQIKLGIDGCGVPVFGLPLRNMALAYARLALPDSFFSPARTKALNTIRTAMTSYPYYVAGTGRLDTILMEATKGKVVAKLGSEGVYCIGLVERGIGIALKIEDGNYRAIDPVVIQLLKQFNYITEAEFTALRHLWRPVLKNHRGNEIGHLEAAF